jgi:nicotinate-nucleotide adenylyltransferase
LDVYPCADINLIIGADAFNEIDTWKDYRELIQLVSFIVIKRNGTIKLKKNILKTVKSAFFPDNPIIEISSSEIRENIKKGFPIKYLLPQSVEKYILDKELYRN